ncbi:hypothetical protein ACHAXT_002562 [Thalassiosira profunda]
MATSLADQFFAFLNAGALLGWSLVLGALLLRSVDPSSPLAAPFFEEGATSSRVPLLDLLLFLEGICFVEVGRIAAGQLKGNLVLGVVLHLIRLSCLLLVLPDGLASPYYDDEGGYMSSGTLCTLVLFSWSLTEVGRYPMYIFTASSAARYIRLVLPIFSFPVGAAAEAIGAYRVLTELLSSGDGSAVHWIKVGSLGMVVLINSLLGPTMAYPALLKKGVPVLLGRAKEKKAKAKKKKA